MVKWLAYWTFNLEVSGSSLVSAIVLFSSLVKILYSILSLFTQVYKLWVTAIIMLGVTWQWTGIPSREEKQYFSIPSHFMVQKPELSAYTNGPLGS